MHDGLRELYMTHSNENPTLFFLSVILEKPIRIPRSLSVKASSCLKGFLNKDPSERLGCHLQTGFGDIMSHLFFRPIDWDAVRCKDLSHNFVPFLFC